MIPPHLLAAAAATQLWESNPLDSRAKEARNSAIGHADAKSSGAHERGN